MKSETITPRQLAKRIRKGEKWGVIPKEEMINRYLTEALGECWHEWLLTYDRGWVPVGVCRCGEFFYSVHSYNPLPANNDFFNAEGFFKLLNFAKEHGWFSDFVELMDVGNAIEAPEQGSNGYLFDIQSEFINPTRFATVIYEFLKEEETKP